MTSNDIIYLLIAVMVCISTWMLSKDRSINWLLHNLKKVPDNVSIGISFLAAVSLLILLADEIGLFLGEWGYSNGPLEYTRWVMGIRGISHFLYLMNLVLLAPALWEFLNALHFDKKMNIEQLNVTLVLVFINLTLLVTALQFIVWKEVDFLSGIIIIAIISISLSAASKEATKLQMQTSEKMQPIDRLRRWNAWLLLFGMTFLQTMITKAGLLLVLIPYTRRWILGFVNDMINTISNRNTYSKNKNLADIKNEIVGLKKDIDETTSMKKLSEKIFPKKWVSNKPALLGFYFLCTSGFSMIFLLQAHASPFPPSDSGFPKTETVSLIYTLDILLFLWALTTKRFTALAVAIASVILIFTRYLLPLFAPMLFMPPLDPPGLNVVASLTEMFGVFAWPVSGFIINILVFLLFAYQAESLLCEQALYIDNKFQHMKRIGVITLGSELVLLFVFMIIGSFGLFFLALPPNEDFTGSKREWSIMAHITISIYLIVVGFLYTHGVFSSYRRKTSPVDQLYFHLNRWLGEQGINQMRSSFPVITHFGEWHRSHGRKGRDWLVAYYILSACIFFGGALLVFYMGIA